MAEQNRYRIDAVYQAGKIIETVAMSREPMGVADIAKALNITPNKALRNVATLIELGIFQWTGDKLELGMKLALYWARKKSRLEGESDRVHRDLNSLENNGEEA